MKKLHNIRNVVCIGHIVELEIFFIFFLLVLLIFFLYFPLFPPLLLLLIPLQDNTSELSAKIAVMWHLNDLLLMLAMP